MVYDGEKLLRSSYDYSITSYSNIQDDGALIVTVTGTGDYSGSVEVLTAINRVEQHMLVKGVPQDPIICGQSVQIEASGIGEIQYASDDPSIAEVDAEGWIRGTGSGLVSITVSASGNQYYKPGDMFHYRTKLNVEPYDRVFRNFSIEDEPEAFHAQADYGEEYAER